MRHEAMRLSAWLVVPALFAAASARAQTQTPTITIPRLTRAPAIDYVAGQDGHATDSSLVAERAAEGLGVAVTDFRQREPGDGTPASRTTIAYLSYDDANLYVVFICKDDPAKVRAHVARREDITSDDQVVVYLDTFRDRKRAYFFMANPLGVQLDGITTEGQDDDVSWDAVWQSDGRLTPEGYVVQMAIPFRSLRFSRAEAQTWGIALGRIIRRSGEESYWPLLTKRVKGVVPHFASLEGMADISPGRNVQVNPYSTLARARALDEDTPGFIVQGDQRLGMDAKVVLRDALTMDATLHPDFSQVETDDPQVTVNQRFEVLFPEKRPFFIENAGYFQTPVNLFFSRRIVDPGGGVRLTGKAGRWALGTIFINDRAPSPNAASVGAFRVQRELGDESTLGALVTERELAGSYSRMVSFDTRLKLARTWAAVGQVMRNQDRAGDSRGTRTSGSAFLVGFERDGRAFDYTAQYAQFSPDFAAPLGYVKRVGIGEAKQEMKYRWRPVGSAILNYGPLVKVVYTWDPSGLLLDRELKGEFQVELVGQTELRVERHQFFERFDGFPFLPFNTQAAARTEIVSWLSIDATYTWGTAVNHDPPSGQAPFLGDAAETEVIVALRPTPQLRLDQTFLHSRLDTQSGARAFTERQFRTKVNYQCSRFLSVRAIIDRKAESGDTTLADVETKKKWGVDFLLTYLVNPGTAFYVGYTDHYENLALRPGLPPSLFRSRAADVSVGRQVFVKLSYLWRF